MPGIEAFDLNIPKTEDLNKWGDVVEIFCLLLEEGAITKDELFDRIFDENIGDIDQSVQHFQDDESATEEEVDSLLLPEIEDYSTSNESRQKDLLMSKIDNLFGFLERRSLHNGNNYPFKLEKGNKLIVKPELNPINELYIALLIASNLDIAKNYLHGLTKEFERISLATLKYVFGSRFQVEYFGATLSGVDTKFNKTKLKDRLIQLQKTLSLNFNPSLDLDNDISDHNSGDYGLDIIAWHEFEDSNSNTFLYFIQCACGKNWVEKQFESSSLRWENIFVFTNKPVSIIMIPRSLRDDSNNWNSVLNFRGSVIIDRYRIIQTLSNEVDFSLHNDVKTIIEEIQDNKISYFD